MWAAEGQPLLSGPGPSAIQMFPILLSFCTCQRQTGWRRRLTKTRIAQSRSKWQEHINEERQRRFTCCLGGEAPAGGLCDRAWGPSGSHAASPSSGGQLPAPAAGQSHPRTNQSRGSALDTALSILPTPKFPSGEINQQEDSTKNYFLIKAYMFYFPACFGWTPFQDPMPESLNESNWVPKGFFLYYMKLN